MHAAEQGQLINVLIGGVDLTRAPNRLSTVLGSCIGLVLYDLDMHLAGMAHILLPDGRATTTPVPAGKYADRAVPTLLEALVKHGGRRAAVVAKFAGGARMFSRVTAGGAGDVGAANVAAVRAALTGLGIKVRADDVGGSRGRKIVFDPATGALDIHTLDTCNAI